MELSQRLYRKVNLSLIFAKNFYNACKKAMNKLCDWIDSSINDDYLTEDDAKVDKYEKMKNDLNEYVCYLWR